MSQSLLNQPRAGYTLPVFVCAAAIAALRRLHQEGSLTMVPVDLLEPPAIVEIPVEQVACLSASSALAMTRSDPGDNLDLTRNMAIWVQVTVIPEASQSVLADQSGSRIILLGGEGIGRLTQSDGSDKPAIYAYARQLIEANLSQWLSPNESIEVMIIFPDGRKLAERTSNAAFGVVNGLSLLGTSGISQPLSAPGQLEEFRLALQTKAAQWHEVVFCIGENGADLAQRLGINPERLIKTANWLGPLLVEAGGQGINQILLFGYHGKLIKLAGGIFHTHHYLADGRREIMAAYGAMVGLSTEMVQQLFACATTEEALDHLRQFDTASGGTWVNQVYRAIAQQIDERSKAYIYAHTGQDVRVGSILFDRNRKIVVQSDTGATILPQVLLS